MQTQKYPAHFLVKCRAFFIRADAVRDFMEFLVNCQYKWHKSKGKIFNA